MQQVGWAQPPINVTSRLRPLLSLVPLNAKALESGQNLLRALNRHSLESLESQLTTKTAEGLSTTIPWIPVILGCRSRRQRAEACQQRFQHTHPWPRPLMLEGSARLPDWQVHYCPNTHRLTVPVDDSYAALPQKMLWLLLALALLRQPPSILKMDDDAQPGNFELLAGNLQRLNSHQTNAAVGYPIRVPSRLSLDRGWHLGKSSARGNRRVFNSLGAREWLSGGVGYLLSSKAVSQLGQYALHSWGFVESMLYEDVCVSMLLEAADLPVYWLKQPDQLGLQNERASEIGAGQWRNYRATC